jgi:hypothetical protein
MLPQKAPEEVPRPVAFNRELDVEEKMYAESSW